jgi:hypothetical protein
MRGTRIVHGQLPQPFSQTPRGNQAALSQHEIVIPGIGMAPEIALFIRDFVQAGKSRNHQVVLEHLISQ